MEILVIDGLGGGIGKSIVEAIKKECTQYEIIAVGTNSAASSNMKKGGADYIATGENAVIYNASRVSMIVGPIGIVFGNSMHGEITPAMAQAISCSDARKYLLPMSKCNGYVIGVESKGIQEYIEELINLLK